VSSKPVIIIGAPRSGTNMLRDVLTKLPAFHTWPCDEINFVWKHGNLGQGHDLLTPDQIKPTTRHYVASQFANMANTSRAPFLVEKTCANSLRIPFVEALVPDARYIILLRDGPDAIASTIKRWRDPSTNWKYLWSKFKFVAMADRPRVLLQVFNRRIAGLFCRSEIAWRTWGPVFPELKEAVSSGRSLDEICALQWSRCVEQSLEDLAAIDSERQFFVKYEEFVASPEVGLHRILKWLNNDTSDADVALAVASVTRASVGKSDGYMDDDRLDRLRPIISGAKARMELVLRSAKAAD
jgi:hypothetical protein